jgi:hypothetical protein
MPSGGKREGAGRPALPKSKKRIMVSVKVKPEADRLWAAMAKSHDLSKGKLVEKFVGLDPEPGPDDNEPVKKPQKKRR